MHIADSYTLSLRMLEVSQRMPECSDSTEASVDTALLYAGSRPLTYGTLQKWNVNLINPTNPLQVESLQQTTVS